MWFPCAKTNLLSCETSAIGCCFVMSCPPRDEVKEKVDACSRVHPAAAPGGENERSLTTNHVVLRGATSSADVHPTRGTVRREETSSASSPPHSKPLYTV